MEVKTIYSNELNHILNFMSTKLVEDNPTTEIGIEYFLLAVLENTDCSAYKALNSYLSSIILETIHNSYYEFIHNNSLTIIKPNRNIAFSRELSDFILKANYEKELLDDNLITSLHVMLSILNNKNGDNKIKKFFETTALTYDILLKKIKNERKEKNISFEENNQDDYEKNEKKHKSLYSKNILSISSSKQSYINTYCIDISKEAKNGKIDKLVGREKEINQIIKILGRRNKNNALLIGENGVGKCLAKGTKILMYDGSFKKVEDLNIGDLLMGIDSSPRKILNLGHGFDTMYEIHQKNGMPYTVNSKHILSLKDKNDNIHNICIRDYIELSENDKKELKGFKPKIIIFPEKPIRDKAYEVGYNLTDYIPSNYKLNNIKIRFELLSGIIDAMGSKIKDGFKITCYNKNLLEDIRFLCNSMGLLTKYHKYYINVYGGSNISLEHLSLKKLNISHIKNLFFDTEMEITKVKEIGIDEYFGFVIDGDNLFILEDFTVTHNTHICKGLAYLIENGNVPQMLLNKKIVLLDITSMLAGTQFRGMFEDRMKGLIDELKSNKNYILFIDDIHSILSDRPKSDIDVGSMINNLLNDGSVQFIATTTFKDYRSSLDLNPNLARKFQKVIIEPSSIEESINILNNIKGYYEKFHHVKYTDNAIKLCVKLANRYIPERNLPDSAIDILDEAGSGNNLLINEPNEIKKIKNENLDLNRKKEIYLKEDNYEKVDEIDKQIIKNKANIHDILSEKRNNITTIDSDIIYHIISDKTGVPINKLDNNEKKNLLSINEILKKSVIGQDEAIDKISQVIKRSRIGISLQTKTMGNIFMLGSSGCGKTLLAKKLAKEIFGDEKYLVRFDMSEYSDKTSINKLIGSNPGYVGYDNGGQLTEAIKNKKHCVLLLDEIEKADSEIYNLFLQLFDEGYLTDNVGQKIDFKNVIVLLTSNIGTKEANEMGKEIGLVTNSDKNKKNIIEKELKRKFPPEFINRLDDIIYFNTLSDDNLKKIIDIELCNLNNRLKNINYSISYNEKTIDYIFNIIIKDKEYGARPIIRAIQDEIENKITDLLLSNDYDSNYCFNIEIKENNLLIS